MREIRVAPRLWWASCVFWSGFIGGASLSAFTDAVTRLPHDHLANTTAATISLLVAALMMITLRYAAEAVLYPPPPKGEHDD